MFVAKEITDPFKPKQGKVTFLLTHLGFLLLALASIYYYEERIFGSDPSSYLLGVIESGWFFTYNWRISIWLSQWLPLFAVWLGLSMKSILIAHSLGNVINFYLAYLVGHFVFRRFYAGGIMLLIQTLGLNFSYFAWPYGEVQYGICLLIILYWLVTSYHLKVWHWSIVAVIIAFIIGSHPLVWVVLFMLIAMMLNERHQRLRAVLMLGTFSILLICKMVFLPSYDGSLIDDVLSGQSLFAYINVQGFLKMLATNRLLFGALSVLSAYLMYERKWLFLTSIGTACISITLTIGNYAPLAEATQQYYLAFSGVFLVGSLFALDTLAASRTVPTPSLVYTGLIMLAAVCFIPIWASGHPFQLHTQGLRELAEVCRMLPQHRAVINGYNLYKDPYSGMYPDTYEELLLLSAQDPVAVHVHVYEKALECYSGIAAFKPDGPRNNRSIYSVTRASQDSLIAMLVSKNLLPNPKYFGRIKNSYGVLNTMALNEKSTFDSLSVSICVEQSNWLSSSVGVHVHFENRSDQTIYSGLMENLHYTVGFISMQDTIKESIPVRNDIYRKMEETVVLYPPKGVSEIRFELIGRTGVLANKSILL